MKKLFKAIGWDLLLLWRYKLIIVAAIISIVYTLVLIYFRQQAIEELLIGLIFSDPVMLGFLFVGVMILFEKDSNTLQAIIINPLKNWQYIWAKAISLTFISTLVGLIMLYAGYSGKIQPLYMLIALSFTSILFVFFGVIGVVRVRTFIQYMIIIPMFLMPMIIPLLDFFRVYTAKWMYLIPSHASLILMKASIQSQPAGDIIYAIFYLLLWIIVAYKIAQASFVKYIVEKA